MILIRLKEEGAVPRNMAKAWNEVRRDGYRAIGVMWHRDMRPDHFTEAGARKYKYLPRKGENGNPAFNRNPKTGKLQRVGGYTARKLKLKGHTRPLVWSGLSEALSRIQDVRVTSKGARVVLHTPGLNRRHKKSKIRMHEEMTRILEPEARQLAKEYERVTAKAFKRIRKRSTKKIK